MCAECGYYPCHPRCPNADEPRVVCKCDVCGNDIYEGDTMYVIKDDNICEECIEDGETTAEFD